MIDTGGTQHANTCPGEFDRFSAEALEQMAFRFEKPQSRNRWDKPLVVVQPIDAQDMDKEDWIREQQRCRAEITGEFTLARGKGASERQQPADDRDQDEEDFTSTRERTPGHHLAEEMLKEQRKALGGDETELQGLLLVEEGSSDDVGTHEDERVAGHTEEFVYMPLEALKEVEQALFGSAAYKPNTATQPVRLESTNFVHELDLVTQQVIGAIMDAQNTYAAGTEFAVPGCSQKVRSLLLHQTECHEAGCSRPSVLL